MSGPSPQMRVAMAAFALAMRAREGRVEGPEVAAVLAQAQELLAPGEPLLDAVTRFAVQGELAMAAEDWAGLGRALARAVELALVPVPPDLHRVDIHG